MIGRINYFDGIERETGPLLAIARGKGKDPARRD